MQNSYTFHNPDTNLDELVMPELWTWEVHYKEGQDPLYQFNEADATFHQMHEIDHSKPYIFVIRNTNTNQLYTLLIDPKKKRVFFYWKVSMLAWNTPQRRTERWVVFGYMDQYTKEKTNFIIMPPGELVITNDIDSIQIQ